MTARLLGRLVLGRHWTHAWERTLDDLFYGHVLDHELHVRRQNARLLARIGR